MPMIERERTVTPHTNSTLLTILYPGKVCPVVTVTVKLRMHNRYLRQRLHKHKRIRNILELRKTKLTGCEETIGIVRSVKLQKELERITRLKLKIRDSIQRM